MPTATGGVIFGRKKTVRKNPDARPGAVEQQREGERDDHVERHLHEREEERVAEREERSSGPDASCA